MENSKRIVVSGKRKRAIAKAEITPGNGHVSINRIDHKNLHLFDKLKIEEPLRIAQHVLGDNNFNIRVTVKGGGEKGQIDAARIAISRSIVKFTGSIALKRAYSDYDKSLLVADVRRKETYKPGDSKARRRRQKSYR